MLVLTRNIEEAIYINGETIKIIILNICGNQVRIGIEAPKEITVHREEIYHRIQEEKIKA